MIFRNQAGLATLSVVAGTLLVAGVTALSIAKLGVNEIKKSQNHVVMSRNKALAESGLECAVAKVNQKKLDPANEQAFLGDLSSCKDASYTLTEVKPSLWLLSAQANTSVAKVLITATASGSPAAFKSSGSVLIQGGNEWVPAKGEKLKDGYACTAVISGGDITIDPGTAKFETRLNGSDTCALDYSTVVNRNEIKSNTKTKKELELDMQDNVKELKLFEDHFRVPREKWQTIKNQFQSDAQGTVINTGTRNERVKNCGALVKAAINNGKKKIWVEGDCDFSSFGAVNDVPALVVVKDGVFTTWQAVTFKGVLFHFNINYSAQDITNAWGAEPDAVHGAKCAPDALRACAEILGRVGYSLDKFGDVPFFYGGAFETTGGYIIDFPNTTSWIFGSFKPGYDKKMMEELFDGFNQTQVLKGSFHDF